jgi:hypothetical protein
MNFARLTVALVSLIVLLALPATAAFAAGKFVVIRKVKLEGGIVQARLLSDRLACATQGEEGRIAFFDTVEKRVDYHLSESGTLRRFIPTLLAGLGGRALVYDAARDRIEYFQADGNSLDSLGLPDGLSFDTDAPVSLIPLGGNFKDGIALLTERGRLLRFTGGKLASTTDLRAKAARPELFFSRLTALPNGAVFAFSPNTGAVFTFAADGTLSNTVDLAALTGGLQPVTDAAPLAGGGMLFTSGKRLYRLDGGKATAIPIATQFQSAAPLFVDTRGDRVLVYNHDGEMLVGELQ